MKILLTNAGKRFNREWIFRNVNLEFSSGKAYAITGANGSGKSTLLQTISGIMQPSSGSISYSDKDNIAITDVFNYISYCAPYLDIIEEFTLTEFLQFHIQFKPLIPGITTENVIELIGLRAAAEKQIRYYSSGMKQRVKLAQAIFSDSAIVLLDEPCSNFDVKGIELYHALIRNYTQDRLVIVCSNDEVEYNFCNEAISMANLKTVGSQ